MYQIQSTKSNKHDKLSQITTKKELNSNNAGRKSVTSLEYQHRIYGIF